MNHFQFEVIIDTFIKDFDRRKLEIEFVELQLFSEDTDKTVIIKNRRFNIVYNEANNLSFFLFILNNSKNNLERIDYLMDEGFDVKNLILDIYYDGEAIDNYHINELIGEQMDLINFLNKKKLFDISNLPIVQYNLNCPNMELFLLPVNDDDYPLKRKYIDLYSQEKAGVLFNNSGNSLKINNSTLLSIFPKVKVYLSSKNSIIAPKDLDNLTINISNVLKFSFSNSINMKLSKTINIDKYGLISFNYISPLFRICDIKTLYLGFLTFKDDKIYFFHELKYLKHSKVELLSNIDELL